MGWVVVRMTELEAIPTEESEAGKTTVLEFLGKEGERTDGLPRVDDHREWFTSSVDPRVEKFRHSGDAKNEAEKHGGQIVSDIGAMRLDAGHGFWRRLKPSNAGMGL
jgi:hypothetical protein